MAARQAVLLFLASRRSDLSERLKVVPAASRPSCADARDRRAAAALIRSVGAHVGPDAITPFPAGELAQELRGCGLLPETGTGVGECEKALARVTPT